MTKSRKAAGLEVLERCNSHFVRYHRLTSSLIRELVLALGANARTDWMMGQYLGYVQGLLDYQDIEDLFGLPAWRSCRNYCGFDRDKQKTSPAEAGDLKRFEKICPFCRGELTVVQRSQLFTFGCHGSCMCEWGPIVSADTPEDAEGLWKECLDGMHQFVDGAWRTVREAE